MAKRLALITTGNGAVGEAICNKLADAGHGVAITYSPSDRTTIEWLTRMYARGYDPRAFGWYACDVTDYESCRRCVAAVTDDRGPIDILINTSSSLPGFNDMITEAQREAVLRSDLDSLLNMTRQVCGSMADRGWGRIVNVAPLIGASAVAGRDDVLLEALGKHDLTKSLALELEKKGVTVNRIMPRSARETARQAAGRATLAALARPSAREEVATLVQYLCSDAAALYSGANIAVNV